MIENNSSSLIFQKGKIMQEHAPLGKHIILNLGAEREKNTDYK
jgi:hypothetical protein